MRERETEYPCRCLILHRLLLVLVIIIIIIIFILSGIIVLPFWRCRYRRFSRQHSSNPFRHIVQSYLIFRLHNPSTLWQRTPTTNFSPSSQSLSTLLNLNTTAERCLSRIASPLPWRPAPPSSTPTICLHTSRRPWSTSPPAWPRCRCTSPSSSAGGTTTCPPTSICLARVRPRPCLPRRPRRARVASTWARVVCLP